MGAGAGSDLLAHGEQMLPEHPLQLPRGGGCHVLVYFGARRAEEQVVPLPSSGSEPPIAFNAAVKAEWHRGERGQGI